MSGTVLSQLRVELTGKRVWFESKPDTADIMQALIIADKPYGLLDPPDYSELCLIIQYCVSLAYSTVDLENTLSDWEAGFGPHYDEPEEKSQFTDHVLSILGLN